MTEDVDEAVRGFQKGEGVDAIIAHRDISEGLI